MFLKTIALAILPTTVTADKLLNPLPPNASDGAFKFQPLLDFDTNTCYHTAAIDAGGNINEGMRPSGGVSFCRSEDRLWHCNTYSREKCNHYWCAYMYAYYSEMDYAGWTGGHRHDWEHVIVWALHNEVKYVSWSAHGDYTTKYHTEVRFDGTRPKFVAHHGYFNTGSLRRATEDDEKIENHLGKWFTGHLVSMEKMNPDLAKKLNEESFGSAHLDLRDDRFSAALEEAMPWDAKNNEGFDPHA